MRRRCGFSYVTAVTLLVIAANDAKAQAWVLPRGEGAVSFIYQRIDKHDHQFRPDQRAAFEFRGDRRNATRRLSILK